MTTSTTEALIKAAREAEIQLRDDDSYGAERESAHAALVSALAAIEQPTPNQSPAAACDDTQSYKKAYEILRDAMQFCRPEHVTNRAISDAESILKEIHDTRRT